MIFNQKWQFRLKKESFEISRNSPYRKGSSYNELALCFEFNFELGILKFLGTFSKRPLKWTKCGSQVRK